MTLSTLIPKWLVRKLVRPQPHTSAQPHLKKRQTLPTLPANRPATPGFPDDNSPPGYRIQWRQ